MGYLGDSDSLLLLGCINFRANEPNTQMKEYPSQHDALSSGLPICGEGQHSVYQRALTHTLGVPLQSVHTANQSVSVAMGILTT